jgi:hypothetical protein
MMNQPLPPCLIIGFARFEGVARTIDVLAKSKVKLIYLALDGPKTPQQSLIQSRIVDHAEEVCTTNGIVLYVWQRKNNLGVAASIMSAIDWFFSQVQSGIILEDDLIFDSSFLNFSSQALDYFKDDSRVWLISGNNYFSDGVVKSENSWSTYPLIWGWATWNTRWHEIRNLILSNVEPDNSKLKASVRNYWKAGLRRSRVGKLDSWAAPLAAIQHSMFRYTVIPPTNLVANVGNDSAAVHTLMASWHMGKSVSSGLTDYTFAADDREKVSEINDFVLETKVYEISFKNRYSLILMLLLDEFRFPRKNRLSSLKSRMAAIELPK